MPTSERERTDHMSREEIEYEVRTRPTHRIEVWETVPVWEQDSGANDEGYCYQYCTACGCVTEHDDCGTCLAQSCDAW
jgi:hypothetical protein